MILLSLFTFALVLLGTYGWIQLGKKNWFLDVPGARSSHHVTTVRGAGVIFGAVFILCNLADSMLGWQSPLSLWQLLLLLIVVLLGLFDDFRDFPAAGRLAVHLLLNLALFWPFLQSGAIGLWSCVVLVLAGSWLINLYNFMDGIDGLAAIEALSVGAVMAAVFAWQGQMELAQLCVLLCVSVLGFLYWNFPVARVFMGDAGSGVLGLFFVVLALLAAQQSLLTLGALFLLLSVFIVDASWTLLVRLLTGQRIWSAHKLHAYQLLSQRLQSHSRVCWLVLCYNMGWLTPLVWLWLTAVLPLAVVILLAWTPLIVLCVRLRAGRLPVAVTLPAD